MRVLDRLRALEESREAPDHELTRPTEGASVSSVSTESAPFENFAPANDHQADAAEQAAELRRLVAIIAVEWLAEERVEALAAALADPEAALTSVRALVAGLQTAPPTAVADNGMRTCRQCANLSASGRCLAAWRGESFGDGIAVRRDFAPLDPDRPQHCAGYSPGPDDTDRRTGAERWPLLIAACAT